jgi:hypothetical protein
MTMGRARSGAELFRLSLLSQQGVLGQELVSRAEEVGYHSTEGTGWTQVVAERPAGASDQAVCGPKEVLLEPGEHCVTLP